MLEAVLAAALGWVLALHPAAAHAGAVDRAFPVLGRTSYAAAHHDYPAADVFAGCGRRAVSPVDGVVLELSRRDRWDPVTDRGAARGGKFVSVRGDDGVRYYLSHFSRVRPSLRVGERVAAGQPIARVGNTGSARGVACHVHVGIGPVCRGTGDWAVRRGVVAPYPFLRSWERGGNRSPRPAVTAWKQGHGCG